MSRFFNIFQRNKSSPLFMVAKTPLSFSFFTKSCFIPSCFLTTIVTLRSAASLKRNIQKSGSIAIALARTSLHTNIVQGVWSVSQKNKAVERLLYILLYGWLLRTASRRQHGTVVFLTENCLMHKKLSKCSRPLKKVEKFFQPNLTKLGYPLVVYLRTIHAKKN